MYVERSYVPDSETASVVVSGLIQHVSYKIVIRLSLPNVDGNGAHKQLRHFRSYVRKHLQNDVITKKENNDCGGTILN